MSKIQVVIIALTVLLAVLVTAQILTLAHIFGDHASPTKEHPKQHEHGATQVPMPSQTAGHHGGELASTSVGAGGDVSYLQHGRNARRNDYLIVCDATRNGVPARGSIIRRAPGPNIHYPIEDNYRSSGCSDREFPFSGIAHDINGRNTSRH